MKGIKFFALLAMIWSTAAYTKFASIRPLFEHKPILSLIFFFVAAVVYRLIDEFD